MSKRLLALAAVLALSGRAAADGLSIGDPAPKLEVKEFVKGEPVKELAKGKVYVIEFWATWCGPCRTSIPHVSDLQKKYKDAVFIGVSVFERDNSKVKPFVEEMGDKMSYRVATDDDGKMGTNWMEAANQDGIPAAFIVNAEGKVAWIGHPMQMDKPLDAIVAGKWDLAKAATDFKKAAARAGKMRDLQGKVRKALMGKDYKGLVAIVDEAVKDDAELEKMLAALKMDALNKLGEVDKVIEYGTKLLDGIYKGDAQNLNNIAWPLVEAPGDKPSEKLMKFALKLAEAADKAASEKDGAIADTLAKAYYENGDVAKALSTQERAMKLIKGTELADDQEMKDRLEMYKKKVAKM